MRNEGDMKNKKPPRKLRLGAFFTQTSEVLAPDPADLALFIVLVPGEPDLTLDADDLSDCQYESITKDIAGKKTHIEDLSLDVAEVWKSSFSAWGRQTELVERRGDEHSLVIIGDRQGPSEISPRWSPRRVAGLPTGWVVRLSISVVVHGHGRRKGGAGKRWGRRWGIRTACRQCQRRRRSRSVRGAGARMFKERGLSGGVAVRDSR